MPSNTPPWQTPSAKTNTKSASIEPGRYRHYKGNFYEVVAIARHSETMEELVVYQALYGDRGLWVRPLTMFQESVQVDGKWVLRFERIMPTK